MDKFAVGCCLLSVGCCLFVAKSPMIGGAVKKSKN